MTRQSSLDKRPTILLVDDLPDNLYVFTELLRREGYEVIAASNGKKALELLYSHPEQIDLVLSDVMMPEMTGFELCKLIKGDDRICEIPIILITAQLMNEEHAVEGLEGGADDYISRPISPNLLTKKINAVIERKSMADRWREKSRRTQEALEVKEWHTRMLIHDLRNPLTSAMGFLSILAMDDSLSARHRELISKIQNAIQKEAELLEDMLTLIAAREGRLYLELENFNLMDQITEVMFLEEGAAAKKGVIVEKESLVDDLTIYGDRRLIGRVLTNLLDNAIKHAPRGTSIRINAFRNRAHERPYVPHNVEEGWIVCGISNLGSPIPEDSRKKIFEPFVQIPKDSRMSCLLGVGLGLSFCQEIVRLHGGKIGVISPIPGLDQGTIFYFSMAPA
ncbi:Two-component system sensor histidine kinase/response regulator, hybrid [Dissulfuribacter thermophilus]|uniref:histidine kinase n=1 Tax=Dissulfuribacter thermophilus TaxID=1156395 RepID=A0A1B9F451_9BACT|nr:hybrid sensor histidine kinase/response regulator [Dissulfuribacter thermophilus]OCC14531.1 Two-component system sensor histidine kinase/response regulator, hybrid [Dissulfuribacter thermophilus]